MDISFNTYKCPITLKIKGKKESIIIDTYMVGYDQDSNNSEKTIEEQLVQQIKVYWAGLLGINTNTGDGNNNDEVTKYILIEEKDIIKEEDKNNLIYDENS